MALDDWFLVIPFIPSAIVIAALLGTRARACRSGARRVLILVIGALGWAGTSRIVRSQVLTLREREFVERARCSASRDRTIMRRHILPDVMPLVFANAVLFVSLCGARRDDALVPRPRRPANFSWGQMLNNGFQAGAMTQAQVGVLPARRASASRSSRWRSASSATRSRRSSTRRRRERA